MMRRIGSPPSSWTTPPLANARRPPSSAPRTSAFLTDRDPQAPEAPVAMSGSADAVSVTPDTFNHIGPLPS